MKRPIIIPEDVWANSQLSIVRHTGSISINGDVYTIVNKDGIDVFALSNPHSKYYVKGDMVIPPGEPCDLCDIMAIKLYRQYGRERMLAATSQVDNDLDRLTELKAILKDTKQ